MQQLENKSKDKVSTETLFSGCRQYFLPSADMLIF